MTSAQRSGFDPPQELTKEQVEFLASFADNASTGRRIACGIVHMLVALGTIAGAVAGLLTALSIWHSH